MKTEEDHEQKPTATTNESAFKGEWKRINDEIRRRHEVLFAAANRLVTQQFPERDDLAESYKRATVDVFVEKAQHRLTFRARWLVAGGITTAAISVIILGFSINFLYQDEQKILTLFSTEKGMNGMMLTFLLFRTSAFVALLGGIVYIFSQLSKAFLHEAAVLFSRRHALRFGRLFTYLKGGEIKLKDLQEAFHWNEDFQTAFHHMKTGAADTIMAKTMEAMISAEKFITAVEKARIGNRPKEEDGADRGNRK